MQKGKDALAWTGARTEAGGGGELRWWRKWQERTEAEAASTAAAYFDVCTDWKLGRARKEPESSQFGPWND